MSRELMQMADRIEVLAFEMKAPNAYTPRFVMLVNEMRVALRARLSQCDRCGEVNPAEIHTCTPKAKYSDIVSDGELDPRNKFDTTPPQREWQGLTDDEYELMAEKRVTNYFFSTLDYAHDIEAKLKEKNT